MEYLATFFTHSGAIKYQRFLKSIGISAEAMPVPRKLSSNCGIANKFTFGEDIKTVIIEDIERLYIVEGRDYRLIYKTNEE